MLGFHHLNSLATLPSRTKELIQKRNMADLGVDIGSNRKSYDENSFLVADHRHLSVINYSTVLAGYRDNGGRCIVI